MAEKSYFWDGTATGDATLAPYNDDEYSDVIRDLFTTDRAISGILYSNMVGYNGLLAVTNPSGDTARVANGLALIDGKLYRNSANVDFSPTTSTRYYRIVLQKDFTAQEVRLVLLGPSTSVPGLTQNDGVTWEIPVATIYNSGSGITITDERLFVPRIYTEHLMDDAVTTPKIADNAVTAEKVDIAATHFQLLEYIVVPHAATDATFSNISASFTHLMILGSARGEATSDLLRMQFNADGAANYVMSGGIMYSTDSYYGQLDTASTFITAGSLCGGTSPSNTFSPFTIYITDYTNTSVYTSSISRGDNIFDYVGGMWAITQFRAGYWKNAAAVTSIKLIPGSASGVFTFSEGTSFSLYGLA